MGSLLKSRMDDLLSADVGKHDYDWLLTPPGTPPFSLSESSGNPAPNASPMSRSRSNTRSMSTGKTSRFSASQAEHATSARAARSSSTTRFSSISVAPSSSSPFCSNSRRPAILTSSTASVTSKPPADNRPSRPTSTPPSHSPSPHSSTAVKARPSTADKPRAVQNPRPCTPPVRPPASLTTISSTSSSATAAGIRSNCRTATPTRRAAAAPPSIRSASVGRAPATSSKSSGVSATRPGSPAPRTRAPAQPIVLPERAVSARRQRAGTAQPSLRGSSKSETAAPASAARRPSASPVATRGRLQDNSSGNYRMNFKASEGKAAENKKQLLAALEAAARRATKQALPAENTAFGRSISSKKSMDMAFKHLDNRQNMAVAIRGTVLFPQSIRSTGQKVRPSHSSGPPPAPNVDKQAPQVEANGASSSSTAEVLAPNSLDMSIDGVNSTGRNGDLIAVRPSNDQSMVMARKISMIDIYESSRYDMILQKEDSKSMNWLHSVEDKCDQSPSFDYRFGPLPEPFGLI